MPKTSWNTPQSLDQLRQLMSAINNQTIDLKLGKRSKEALTGLLNMPEQAAFESINQLGKNLDINPSTLSRLATRLGYAGFNELQKVFQTGLTEPSHFYSDKLSQLNQGEPADPQSSWQKLLYQVAEEEIANIHKMVNQVAADDISNAIDLLTSARQVRTFAQRQYYGLATYFSYCLGLLRDQVSVLGESGHGAAHGLSQMHSDDLLVVFGSYPYSTMTVESCRIAKQQGIQTMVFSDAHGAPLNDNSQALFVLPTESSFYSNSSASWLVIMQAILTAYAQKLGPDAVAKLDQREKLFEQMQVTFNQ